jgi:hypothetical protein
MAMSIVTKDSYKADIFTFEMEKFGSILNLTINNVISWDWQKLKLTKEEVKGLANFLNKFVEEN